MLSSKMIRQELWDEPWFAKWCEVLKEDKDLVHRKIAEWVYVLQVADEHNLLKPGTKALGFGSGKESVPAALAKYGVDVLATDLDEDTPQRVIWQNGNQWGLSQLNERNICPQELFEKHVSFAYCDMNNIPEEYYGQYDLTYSCCSMEHLGSIYNGLQFLLNQAKCLAPGGVGVHSMEFNVSSNDQTVDFNETVLFRKQDLQAIRSILLQQGYRVSELDWEFGDLPKDVWVDTAPFSSNVGHLKLQLWQYVAASFVMVIERPA